MQIHTKDDPLPDPASIEFVEADDCNAAGVVAFDEDGKVLGSITMDGETLWRYPTVQ